MSTVSQAIIEAKVAEVAQTTQYTSTAVKTIIDKFTANNTTGGNITLAVNLVASGGAAATANLVVNKTILAGQCYTFPELVGQVLEEGDFISTLAGGLGLTIRASGRQISVD